MSPPPAGAVCAPSAASSGRPLPRRVHRHDCVAAGRTPCGWRTSRAFGWRFTNGPG